MIFNKKHWLYCRLVSPGPTTEKKTPEFVGLFSFSDRQHNIDREKSSHNERFILFVLIYAIPYYNKLASDRALR